MVALKGALGVSRKPELCVIWTQTGMISGSVASRVQYVLLMYVLGTDRPRGMFDDLFCCFYLCVVMCVSVYICT